MKSDDDRRLEQYMASYGPATRTWWGTLLFLGSGLGLLALVIWAIHAHPK